MCNADWGEVRMKASADTKRYIILGGGISGLSIASLLSRVPGNTVSVIEARPLPGGLASTHEFAGFHFDSGSHRLHGSMDGKISGWIHTTCNNELFRVKRQGRIHVQGEFLDYPLHIPSMLSAFGSRRFWPLASNFIAARLHGQSCNPEELSYEEYVKSAIGNGLYEVFFRPYAEKLYGRPASEITAEPAVHRMNKFRIGDFFRLVRKNGENSWRHHFLYPRKGIGQIAEGLSRDILRNGGRILAGRRVQKISLSVDGEIETVVVKDTEGNAECIGGCSTIISTIPLRSLVSALGEAAGSSASEACARLEWRSLLLLHIILPGKLPADVQTYYFPETRFKSGRISDIGRYSVSLNQSAERAGLTIEIPCSTGNALWSADDGELASLCLAELTDLGLLPPVRLDECVFITQRLTDVYPVYKRGWKDSLIHVLNRMDSISNLHLLGRPAFFLHCNIDHCMAMALRLSELLSLEENPGEKWKSLRPEFQDYSVRE